jgi:FAD/FMN-containing dehydrogenase
MSSLQGFQGRILTPGHGDYDTARSLWKGMDRRPTLILQCKDSADVQRVVEHARSDSRPFAVMNTGHDVAGRTAPDGGIVLSTGLLRGVTIDAERRIATVEAGVRWRELAAVAGAHGLATTGASSGTVGVAGFVLHGGYGLLMRRCGVGCDSIVSLEMVTADGRRLTVDEQSHPDLFWAMRGAGPNFGVVTSISLRLHAIARVIAGVLTYAGSRARDVLRAYREVTALAPDELVTDFYYLDDRSTGAHTASIGVCHTGAPVDLRRALAPLAALGPAEHDSLREMSLVELHALHDHSTPPGFRYHLRGYRLAELDDRIVERFLDGCRRSSAPLTRIFIEHLGGAIARVPPGATSFHGRDAAYSFLAVAGWTDPRDDARHVTWIRDLGDAVRPLAMTAGYVNYLDADEQDRIPDAYGSGYARLLELKRRHDPDNFFRACANLRTAPPPA